MHIGGCDDDAADGESIGVVNPATGEQYTTIPRGKAADVDRAVRAARNAFDGSWGRTSALDRSRLLLRISGAVLDNLEELAHAEAIDTGKPISTARNDMRVLARYFEFYGGAADKLHGEIIPTSTGYFAALLRQPLGVTAHIIPWNYPAMLLGRSIAPALAMGNATVLKPSEDTSITALRFAKLAEACGMPAGVINVVTGLGEEAGAALARHRGIDFIGFTGSYEAGSAVQKASSTTPIKCVLELGGKSPHLVFADADLEDATDTIVDSIVYNAGQDCSAGSRVLVEKAVYDKFMSILARKFSAKRVGTPTMDLDCGPVMNANQKARIEGFVLQAREAGIPVVAEGQIDKDVPAGGYFVTPTVFGAVPPRARIAQEEIFGPILAVTPVQDEADALRVANSTEYGLSAAIWTQNGARQLRLAYALRAGQVYINAYSAGAGSGVELPFGGNGRSGYGREKGMLALEELSTTKTVIHRYGE